MRVYRPTHSVPAVSKNPMRVYLTTIGCRLNEAELESWANDFQQRGHTLETDPCNSDLVVINTCAVTAEAVRKSRKILARARRSNPDARLVVSGCAASLPATLPLEGIDLLIPNPRKEQLVSECEQHFSHHPAPPLPPHNGLDHRSDQYPLNKAQFAPLIPLESISYGEMLAVRGQAGRNDDQGPPNTPNASQTLASRGRQRAFIKIQDGCRYQCTFCIVTTARGAERSRSPAEIIAEVRQHHRAGVQEITLTGVQLGGYGRDQGSNLSQLLTALLQQSAIPRIRLGALEPWDLPPDLWERFQDPRLLPHLHLPLQSGSDTILRRMARRCKVADFTALTEQARRAIPNLNITTDIIVGFPGEQQAQWQETLHHVKNIGFGDLHIFAYSPRQGTRAATFPDQIPKNVIQQRSAELQQLAQELKYTELQRQIGSQQAVLLEQPDPRYAPYHNHGYTPNYHRIRLRDPDQTLAVGTIRTVRVTAVAPDGEGLWGEG